MKFTVLRDAVRATALAAIALLAACVAGPEIRVSQDPAVDFDSFQTFGFAPAGAAGGASMLNRRLSAASIREFQARGMDFVSNNPDLLVSFYTNIRSGIDTRNRPMVMMPVRNYGSWAGYRAYIAPGDPITEGTLAVHVVDRRRNQLVWEGIAQDRVTQSMQDNPDETVNALITAIFADFPR